MVSCIYQIKSKSCGRVYIGSTNNYKRRVIDHKRNLKNLKHKNTFLQAVHNKHGLENLEFSIIEEVKNLDHLRAIEQSYLDYYFRMYRDSGKGLLININRSARIPDNNGRKLTDEHKRKISENNGLAFKGRKLSDEHRRKLSEAAKGRKCEPFSDEHRRKISEAWLGKKRSETNKKKISEANKGKKLSAEHRRKISENNGLGMKGKQHSEETKAKMSEAAKRRRQS
jgi:group I intron endonuclease